MMFYGRLIKQANYQLATEFDRFAAPYDLTGTQMSVIDFLGRQEDYCSSQQTIEREFRIRRSTTTILLQRMEKKGLIVKKVVAGDQRRRLVQLTAKATKLIPVIREHITASEDWLQAGFTASEREVITAFLQRAIRGNENDDQ